MQNPGKNITIKILFVISSLTGGGAQHVTRTIVKHIDKKIFKPIVITFSKIDKHQLDLLDDVEIISLRTGRARYAIWKIIKIIQKVKPDIIFSVQGYINLLVIVARPLFLCNPCLIARETNLPIYAYVHAKMRWLYKILYRKYYDKFDLIICQSSDMKENLQRYALLGDSMLHLIPNPVDHEYIDRKIKEGKNYLSADKLNVLAVGKLMYQKGFDLLLQALSRISIPSLCLTILGSGPEEKELKCLAKELNLTDRIKFEGYRNNPYSYMAKADVLVLSSRFEGFPNVLLEANACGTPVVAFDCPGGIRDIVIEGFNGWTVRAENIDALSQAIVKVSKTQFDSKKIRDYIIDKFSATKIIKEYEEVFLKVIKSKYET